MTRILLADDHELMREGLRTLLAAQPDVEIVGEAEDGVTAVRRALELRPDIVIMDVGMPQMNGIEATRRLATKLPGTKIIALSMHSDRRYVAEMLKAGAAGYVLKQGAFRELASAIAAVKASHIYLSPRVAGVVVDLLRQPPEQEGGLLRLLTAREREVLQCVAEGMNTKSIADRLSLSGKTVDGHRRHMMVKLGMQSVSDLTRFAIREGLVAVEE